MRRQAPEPEDYYNESRGQREGQGGRQRRASRQDVQDYGGRHREFDSRDQERNFEPGGRDESLQRPRSDYAPYGQEQYSERPQQDSVRRSYPGYGRDTGAYHVRGEQEQRAGDSGRSRGAPENERGYYNRPQYPMADERSFQGSSGHGPYRGRGPKGYKRSDDRIKEDVCDRLTDDDEVNPENITIEVRSGEVHLVGTVSDRRSKRRAEQCVEDVPGVEDVINELRVRSNNVRAIGESSGREEQSEQENSRKQASGE